MRLRRLLPALAVAIIGTAGHAQTWQQAWPGGSLTCTVSSSLGPYGTNYTYSNYIWIDPTGAQHSFNGSSIQAWVPIGPLHPNEPPQVGLRWAPLTATSTDGTWTLTGAEGNSGLLSHTVTRMAPFSVLSVVYAPPGAKGCVTFSSTSLTGTSVTTTNSFANSLQITVTTEANAFIADSTVGGQWTFGQSQTNKNTESVTTSATVSTSVLGGGDGINHDYDQILVWLSPQITYNQQGLTQMSQEIGPDTDYATYMNANEGQALPPSQMDTVAVQVGELRNEIWLLSMPVGTDPKNGPGFAMGPGTRAELQRAWATCMYGSGQALTAEDYATLLARDPFSDPNNIPTVASLNAQLGADGKTPQNRFISASNDPAMAYSADLNSSFSDTWTQSSENSSNVQDQYSAKWFIKGSAGFVLGTGGGVSDTMTWTHSVQHSSTTNNSNTTSVTIYGPAPSWKGNYSNIAVYRDTLYGTYLYVPMTE